MPATSRQQVGSRGRCIALLYPLLSLLLLALASRPGEATIRIPSKYKIKDLKSPPVITAQPKSVTTFSAEDIALTCEATGNPPPTFRWVKDGVEFDPSKDPDLSVSRDSGTFSLTAKDGPIHQYRGTYNCYASNELGTAVSNEARIVTANTPTQQKVKTVVKKVEVGESVVLPCFAPNSTVAPVMHWMDKRLRHIQQNERVIQGRDGNLYFSHVTMDDSREDYTCNTQFPSARIIMLKDPIKLTVAPSNSVVRNRRPQMMRPTGSHSSYLVLTNQTLELECIVQGLPSPKIQWIRKDGVLSEKRTSKESFDRVLLLKNIVESDSGEYQCTATNPQGIATHTYSITVEAAPFWVKKPKSQLYAPRETVNLECKADGIPSPVVTWSINGIPLSDTDPDPRRTLKDGTLTLSNVDLSDTAVYQCKAANKHGTILINAYVYVIELPPQILTEDGLMYSVAEGQKIELACETFGSPLPSVTWEGESWGDLFTNPRMSLLSDGFLQINNASLNDSGQYTCTVKNDKITITAELDVLNKTVIVKPPKNLRIQRGKPATLTCEYQVDARQDAPQVQWRKNNQKLLESFDSDKYVIDESTLIIPEVEEEDAGIYSCEVITTLDVAEATGSITIVDRPDPPTQVLMIEPKDRSVTLSWTPGEDHNSPVLEYLIEFEEVGSEKSEWEELLRVSGGKRRAVLPLKPFISYRFRVIAINEVGKSDPSMRTDAYHTQAAPPDINPEGVRSDSIEPDTLVITWKEIDRRSFNGPGFRYNVMWRKVLGAGPTFHQNFTTSPPFIVTDVGDFAAFDIKVGALNDMGAAPEPKSVLGYSGEDYPTEAPLNVAVELENSTAIEVRWAAVNKDSVRGLLQGYKIYLMHYGPESRHLRRERVREGKPTNISIVTTTNTKEVLGDLQPYSHYALSVSVFNNKGEGPQSEPLVFHTPEGVPGPPSSLLLDSPSETEMTLHWTPPTQPNGVLLGYVLQYQQIGKDSPMQVENIDGHSTSHFTLKKLDPHSRYRFLLRGRTAPGQGLPIIREGATTLDGGPPSNISLSIGETSVNLTWLTKERQRNVGFLIHYLKKDGKGKWKSSEKVNTSQAFYTLQGLQPGSQYRLRFDFSNKTFMETEIVTTGARVMEAQAAFVTEGWFIGLISALVLLLLILLILCFIKRNKGGKYSVKEKEEGQIDSEVRPMNNEAFGEYRSLESDNEEKQTASQPSLCDDSKLCTDDYGNSVQTEVIMDESLASQSSGVRDGPETLESSPLNPATSLSHHGVPNSAAFLD
ncbi:neural cell adhesion molecule L1.2 isoform X1 [Misgurnus anguillicaudatus]|uniref:neural cell adhesion molecule L1.2 isoform X1 n=1 Tax=Misgurnus anguillicaudatus TaxID=75329 RepID=UPI00243497B9|nr:neural cell adhesion molecule L1.2 isoform X1 [Misgurnus anguillicaudatus]